LRKGPVGTQRFDERPKIGDLDREAVPTARLRNGSVGHGLTTAGPAARRAQHKPEITPREHGERGRGMRDLFEVQMAAVEGDRLVDVVHDVTNAHCRHR
jgi:hypothetical protein